MRAVAAAAGAGAAPAKAETKEAKAKTATTATAAPAKTPDKKTKSDEKLSLEAGGALTAGEVLLVEPFVATRVVKRNLELPTPGHTGVKVAFVLENVYTKAECDSMIALTEARGYAPALVNVGYGRQALMRDVRNNDRVMIDDESMAGALYNRIKPFVPPRWRSCDAVSLNERLRFLRYDPGQKFEPHMDGVFMRGNGERSYVTVQLYLNEGFEGGATTFLNHRRGDDVGAQQCVPKTGMVLIFEHELLHEGSAVTKGRKYCLRTDVMYAPAGGRTSGAKTAGMSKDVSLAALSLDSDDDAAAGAGGSSSSGTPATATAGATAGAGAP